MEFLDILKIFGGVLAGAIFTRILKASDSVTDIKIREAVTSEKLSNLHDRVAILERNEKTQWAILDKVAGGNREKNK